MRTKTERREWKLLPKGCKNPPLADRSQGWARSSSCSAPNSRASGGEQNRDGERGMRADSYETILAMASACVGQTITSLLRPVCGPGLEAWYAAPCNLASNGLGGVRYYESAGEYPTAKTAGDRADVCPRSRGGGWVVKIAPDGKLTRCEGVSILLSQWPRLAARGRLSRPPDNGGDWVGASADPI